MKKSKPIIAWAVFINEAIRLDLIAATEDFATALSNILKTAYRGKVAVRRVKIEVIP